MPTILFAGGGSIGHIAPSVAVADAMQEKHKDVEMHFICSERHEDIDFLRRNDRAFTTIPAPKLGIGLPWKLVRATRQARTVLEHIEPTVVFCKGGYVSIPVALAAKKLGIPIVLHESDSVPGRANKLVAKVASHICCGLPNVKFKGHAPVSVTGNPVRKELMEGVRDQGLEISGLSEHKPILLVIGGSQGALSINRIIAEELHCLLHHVHIIHLTGEGKETVAAAETGYYALPFANEELPHLYACADLALSRGGFNALCELAANRIPTIVCPLEGVGHNHQVHNATVAQETGGCIMLPQSHLQEVVVNLVATIADDLDRRAEMSAAIASLNPPDAACQIANILASFVA